MTQNDESGKYEHFKNYIKTAENAVEDKEDRSHLDWYENWKKENFNNEK